MSAFIIASVEKFEHGHRKGQVSSYPSIDIADCSNKVSIDFSFYNEKDMKVALKKAKLFQAVVNDFVAAFEAEIAEYEESKEE